MPRVGNVTVNTTEVDLFNTATDGAPASEFTVRARTGNSGTILVRCPQLGHTTALTGYRLEAGQSVTFASGGPNRPSILQVIASASAVSQIADVAVTAG